jgi:hypothetical protein
VESRAEVKAALNNFRGPIVIFDCHGEHHKERAGTLRIGSESVDTWNFREDIRVPPIVILSTCDTHPIDASHASTANGFLVSGAMTVLATLLPVNAVYAALFIGRLMYRLSDFVWRVTESADRPMTWARIVSGLQRMQYSTELIHMLANELGNLNQTQYEAMSLYANTVINANDDDWFEKSLEKICSTIRKPTTWVRSLMDEKFQLPDVIKYTQLGNPESIMIAPSSFRSRLEMAQ